MEPPLGATHCMVKDKGQQMKSAQEMSVDGQDLTICGGCQGYMDLFSEVFCVVSFFFFFYFTFLHTKKHQDGKHYQRLKEQTLSVTFPNANSVKALVFLCFLVCFTSSFP